MSKIEKTLNQLNNLADTIVDNIMNTPDKEILDEVKEDHGDPHFESNIMKNIIKEAMAEVGKERLNKARSELKMFKDEKKQRPSSKGVTESSIADVETMAARNGKGISENDKAGLLEDLEDLKNMKSNKNKDKS